MKKFYRDNTNKMIFGVCSGFSNYFNVDVVIVRLIFLICSFLFGSSILIYIILAIISPVEENNYYYYKDYSKRKLYKKHKGSMIFGVCSGLSEYSEIDVTIIRLLFVLSLFMVGASFYVYIILAIILPSID